MKRPTIDLHIVNPTNSLFAGLVSVLLSAATPVTFAATNDDAMENAAPQPAYVDSIKKWGAWGLRIEPAAGGIQQPSTQPLKARDSNVSLRTNSISALAPRRTAAGISTPPPSVTPPSPPVIPAPIGGPTNGLF